VSKKLFTPSPASKWHQEVIAGGEYTARFAYILGYYEGARALAEAAIREKVEGDPFFFSGNLFYPICFNYRHFIELSLKHLICATEDLYTLLDRTGDTRGTLSESAAQKLVYEHSLERLLNWLIERLKLVTDNQLDDNVRRIIVQFHNMDPDSQVFRYPTRKDGKLTLPEPREYDLENIRKLMEDVHNEFSGLDAWLDYHADQADEFLTMEAELRDNSDDWF
jgi:hypothetical protein